MNTRKRCVELTQNVSYITEHILVCNGCVEKLNNVLIATPHVFS